MKNAGKTKKSPQKRTTPNTIRDNNVYVRNFKLEIEDYFLLNLDSFFSKKYTYQNEDTYEGDYIDEKRSVKGKYIYENGDVFEGEYKDDVPNGVGKYYFVNGDVFEGEYKDGRQNGKGKYIWKSTGCYFEGEYLNGHPIVS